MTEKEFLDSLVPNGDGCLLWTGSTFDGKYGGVYVNGTRHYTHRLAFELHTGKKPSRGEVVRHTCNTFRCCNPEHLVLGTHQDNMDDLVRSGNRSKYSTETLREIRGRWDTGSESMSSISRSMGIPLSTVRQFIRGLRCGLRV